MKWNKIAYHKDEVVEKSELPALPENFSPSTLGYPKPGSRAQYRGPDGLHVHEYDSYWEVHRDYSDPSTLGGAIVHAVPDAPEVTAGVLTALAVGKEIYDERRSKSSKALVEAISGGIISGVAVWGAAKLIREFLDKVAK